MPAVQRAGAEDLQQGRGGARAARFTLVKVDCTTDDDPAVVAAKQRWKAETLPTLVVVGADGKVAHKIDHFVEPDELLRILGDAS